MNIDKSKTLPGMEYFKEEIKKDTIVLHHTVSSVGKYVSDWFAKDRGKSKVAVAFVIDKDGTIYELFDPKYWAYHTGTGNKHNIDKRSIAIEIVNEGQLIKKGDNFYWWDGKYRYNGTPYDNVKDFRGFRYFASYTEEQIKATLELTDALINRLHLPMNFSGDFDFHEESFVVGGIVMHVNLRATGKWDLSPAFPIDKISEMIEKKKRTLYSNDIWDDISGLKPHGFDTL